MHHTATRCYTLQHTGGTYLVVLRTATHCNTLQHTATQSNYDTLQQTATNCNKLQQTAINCNKQRELASASCVPQHAATHCCNTLHHTTPHCTTLQHSITHCYTRPQTGRSCRNIFGTTFQQLPRPLTPAPATSSLLSREPYISSKKRIFRQKSPVLHQKKFIMYLTCLLRAVCLL